METLEAVHREMALAGQQLEKALALERRLSERYSTGDIAFRDWKAARSLVDRRAEEYVAAVRQYRAMVQKTYRFPSIARPFKPLKAN
jgi:hypothetical protein